MCSFWNSAADGWNKDAADSDYKVLFIPRFKVQGLKVGKWFRQFLREHKMRERHNSMLPFERSRILQMWNLTRWLRPINRFLGGENLVCFRPTLLQGTVQMSLKHPARWVESSPEKLVSFWMPSPLWAAPPRIPLPLAVPGLDPTTLCVSPLQTEFTAII